MERVQGSVGPIVIAQIRSVTGLVLDISSSNQRDSAHGVMRVNHKVGCKTPIEALGTQSQPGRTSSKLFGLVRRRASYEPLGGSAFGVGIVVICIEEELG